MEHMEQEERWDEMYKKSKPLISYSILIGVNMDKTKEIISNILNGVKIDDFQLDSMILSRLPTKDRHDYEFPDGIQDFIFYEGFKIYKKWEINH